MDFEPLVVKDQIETALRDVGLYLDRFTVMSPVEEGEETHDEHRHGAQGRSHILVMECLIGDVAFTSRVQNAEQKSIDDEFALIARDITADEFDQIRKELGGE